MKKITIKSSEINLPVDVPTPDFPKYTSRFVNNANQYSQATWSKNVGQMSNLIRECPGTTLEEWSMWYKKQHPDAIDEATDKIISMMDKVIEAILKIDRNLVRSWVEDLVIVKTFEGLKIQEAILKKLAKIKGCNYRLAEPHEESDRIDGFVGEEAYSIKPISYKARADLSETINAKIIYYNKKAGKNKGDVEFEIPED